MDRAAVNDDTWAINISLDIVALDVRRAIGHKSDAVRLHLQRCKLTTVTGLRRRLGRLLALTRASPAQNDAGPSSPSPTRTLYSPARTLPTPAPTAALPALTMRNAVGRAVIVPILRGWEHYPCNENGGRGWSARIVATRAGRRVSVRFTDARDAAGLKYPNETLPLDVLLEPQPQPHSN